MSLPILLSLPMEPPPGRRKSRGKALRARHDAPLAEGTRPFNTVSIDPGLINIFRHAVVRLVRCPSLTHTRV